MYVSPYIRSTLAKPVDLAEHIGKAMVFAPPGSAREAMLRRLYDAMKPEAKARCDFARSWLVVEA